VTTRRHILAYTLLLVAATFLPVAIGMSGRVYLAAAIALGAIFVAKSWRLLRSGTDEQARGNFRFSITYLALLFLALLVDHYATALR